MKIFLKYTLISLFFLFASCDKQNEENSLLNKNYYSKIQNFKGFYFISENQGNFNLMYYDFLEDSVLKIFSDNSQKVIEVEHNFYSFTTFFVTVNRLNKKTAIPEYEGIKLYRYDPDHKKIDLLNRFSPSIQIYSFWIDINRYKVIRIYFDEIVASYVNKHTLIYNPFGKLLSEENEVFDLVKSGYPVKETIPLKPLSLDKNHLIKFEADSVFIINKELNRAKKLLVNKKVLDLIWTDNEKHLIVFYENPENKLRNILLFDLINNKIVKTFDEKGIKNFLSIGNYLIFDYRENNSQTIEIFNIERLLSIKKISFGKNSYLKNVTLH